MPTEGIPQNAEYLYLGLVVVFGILGAYAASIFWRFRNLQKDQQLIKQLQEEDSTH